MDNESGPQAEGEGGGPSRGLKVFAVAAFSISFLFHLLRGRWVAAAFFVATALLFLVGKRIDGWPKPRRYLAISVYVALAVAMFVEIVREAKAVL